MRVWEANGDGVNQNAASVAKASSRNASQRCVRVAPRSSSRQIRFLFPLLVTLGISINVVGLPYYLLPIAQRVRHPLHQWLKPSGSIGQAAGIATFLLFAFLWLYPLRKRVRWLAFTGALGSWLEVHIAAGLLVPLYGAIHASWRFGGLIGLGYDAIFVVFLSGVVGKYLYTRIPHARSGAELSREQIASEREALLAQLAEFTGLERATLAAMLVPEPSARPRSMLRSVLRMMGDDLRRRHAVRCFARQWRVSVGTTKTIDRQQLRRALRLARRDMALNQQLAMLEATHRVFRFWHAAHLPVAISALLAVLVHVIVVIALGATWFW